MTSLYVAACMLFNLGAIFGFVVGFIVGVRGGKR